MSLEEAAAYAQLVGYYARVYDAYQADAEDARSNAMREEINPGLVRAVTGAAKRNQQNWEEEQQRCREHADAVLEEAERAGVNAADVQRMAAVMTDKRRMLANALVRALPNR